MCSSCRLPDPTLSWASARPSRYNDSVYDLVSLWDGSHGLAIDIVQPHSTLDLACLLIMNVVFGVTICRSDIWCLNHAICFIKRGCRQPSRQCRHLWCTLMGFVACATMPLTLMAEDQHNRYRFASIQGELQNQLTMQNFKWKDNGLTDGDQLYIKSEAVLRAAAGLGGHWRVIPWFRLVPRAIRDLVYAGIEQPVCRENETLADAHC